MAGLTNGSIAPVATACSNYIVFPVETTWSYQIRAVLYGIGLLYCFVGLATITSLYMQAMELIVQQTRKVVHRDSETGLEEVTRERIWNPVIADITLLALGTSFPQISLAIIDAINQLGKLSDEGLGPGTIVGSAAFNLFPILAVCVLVPERGTVKLIQNRGVWIVELVWSFWAYVWLIIILQVSSPNVVSQWEAVLTVLQFPLLMLHAYAQDQGWRLCLPSWAVAHSMGLSTSVSGFKTDHAIHSISARLFLFVQESIVHMGDLTLHCHFCKVRLEVKKPEWELQDLHYHPMPSSAINDQLGRAHEEPSSEHQMPKFTSMDAPVEGSFISLYPPPGDLHSSSCKPEQEDLVAMLTTQETDTQQEQPLTWRALFVVWKEQFCDAVTVKRPLDGNGKYFILSNVGLLCHPISFAWRVMFAFIPPPAMFHGWVAFSCALSFITAISGFVIKLAHLVGCVTGINKYVLAITVLAAGTSWPDLIASKIAAERSATADSAIANINASNCINVFVGIGIPWLLQVFYNQVVLGEEFRVPASGLGFSLVLFFITFALCLVAVCARRYWFGGELGGPWAWAWASSAYFMLLWLIFVVFSCLQAYHVL